jgi:hypothetical protein
MGKMCRGYRLGKIEVVCEGYDYPDDPYILKGSCGLEYNLEYRGQQHGPNFMSYEEGSFSIGSKLGSLFLIGLVVWLVYASCSRQPTGYGAGGDYGGDGGGGGGGWPHGGGGGWHYGGANQGYGCDAPPRATGDGPGFFSGMVTGGLVPTLSSVKGFALQH